MNSQLESHLRGGFAQNNEGVRTCKKKWESLIQNNFISKYHIKYHSQNTNQKKKQFHCVKHKADHRLTKNDLSE